MYSRFMASWKEVIEDLNFTRAYPDPGEPGVWVPCRKRRMVGPEFGGEVDDDGYEWLFFSWSTGDFEGQIGNVQSGWSEEWTWTEDSKKDGAVKRHRKVWGSGKAGW